MINGVFKLIKINTKGIGKNGQRYLTATAVNFFDQVSKEDRENGIKDTFYSLSFFGNKAEFVEKNFKSEDGARRVYLSGELQLRNYMGKQEVTKYLKIEGKKVKATFSVEVEKTSAHVIVDNIRFLDKPNDRAVEVVEENNDDDEIVAEVCDDEDILDETAGEDIEETSNEPVGEHKSISKSKSKTKSKANVESKPAPEEDDEEIEQSDVE